MGVHRFIRCRGLPQKDHCNGLLAKIVGHQKIYGCKHSYRHHGDVHSHHTLCGLFFTAGYRYTGPYDVPLLRVLNQSHVSSTSPMCWALYTPWKAQKHQLRFKKLQGALPGQFFQLLKKKKNTFKLPQKNNLFQRGEKNLSSSHNLDIVVSIHSRRSPQHKSMQRPGIYPGRSIGRPERLVGVAP